MPPVTRVHPSPHSTARSPPELSRMANYPSDDSVAPGAKTATNSISPSTRSPWQKWTQWFCCLWTPTPVPGTKKSTIPRPLNILSSALAEGRHKSDPGGLITQVQPGSSGSTGSRIGFPRPNGPLVRFFFFFFFFLRHLALVSNFNVSRAVL
jgi:hypothetical protein